MNSMNNVGKGASEIFSRGQCAGKIHPMQDHTWTTSHQMFSVDGSPSLKQTVTCKMPCEFQYREGIMESKGFHLS